MAKTFLTAEWRKLIIANYEVPGEILKKYLPNHTELDLWNNTCYVSMVGFMFVNTKVKGIKIPFHSDFEEANLRFYVKPRHENDGTKRGVVFIKEIVPKRAVTFVANTIYKENYETMKMTNNWQVDEHSQNIEYTWQHKKLNSMKVSAGRNLLDIQSDSEAEFITEHYWGYTKKNELQTSEYRVAHPRWQAYEVNDYKIEIDFAKLYGEEFSFLNYTAPRSVFLIEGSEVEVKSGSGYLLSGN